MDKYVVIVAGGKGLRMGKDIPKQFLPIGGKPVLMHTISQFYEYAADMGIILVLPADQHDYWNNLCAEYNFDIPHTVCNGGETRFHSVKNGLKHVPENTIVGIHDGVRPFVKQGVLEQAFAIAKNEKAVVPVIPVIDSLRKKRSDSSSVSINRAGYVLVQTPQVFDADMLHQAYACEYEDHFTDDASVVEAFGQPIHTIQGNRENIKITTTYDLIVAEALCNATDLWK